MEKPTDRYGGWDGGVVVTKYDHVKDKIPGFTCCEAGHPIPDENSFSATAKALKLVRDLTVEDTIKLLLFGGGSALFEQPLVPGEELQNITRQLLPLGRRALSLAFVENLTEPVSIPRSVYAGKDTISAS